MEGINRQQQDREVLHVVVPSQPTPDEQAITLGIAAAETGQREIDDATARRIASQLHGGQGSALYSLASSGKIDEERIYREIGSEFEQQVDPETREWLNWLGAYCLRREHKGPIEGWHETTADEPAASDAAERLGALAAGQPVAATGPEPETVEVKEEDCWKPPIEVWVASLTDYNNGRLHGVWVDATQDPDELLEAVHHLLRNSYFPDAEEWAIFDYEGFGSLKLSEYESLETISKIAKRINEHGLAFAAWAQHVGAENHEQLDRFEDHYRGEYDNTQAYVEEVLDNIGFNQNLDDALRVIPEDLRRYIRLDTEALARDWETQLHVVERPDGGVWVFEP